MLAVRSVALGPSDTTIARVTKHSLAHHFHVSQHPF